MARGRNLSNDNNTGLFYSMSVPHFYGCSTVVLIGFTCPAITVVTVIKGS